MKALKRLKPMKIKRKEPGDLFMIPKILVL